MLPAGRKGTGKSAVEASGEVSELLSLTSSKASVGFRNIDGFKSLVSSGASRSLESESSKILFRCINRLASTSESVLVRARVEFLGNPDGLVLGP